MKLSALKNVAAGIIATILLGNVASVGRQK